MGYKINEVYRLVIKLQRNKERVFRGNLIQETDKFITLKSKNYTESFLKADIGADIKLV